MAHEMVEGPDDEVGLGYFAHRGRDAEKLEVVDQEGGSHRDRPAEHVGRPDDRGEASGDLPKHALAGPPRVTEDVEQSGGAEHEQGPLHAWREHPVDHFLETLPCHHVVLQSALLSIEISMHVNAHEAVGGETLAHSSHLPTQRSGKHQYSPNTANNN